MTELDDDDLLEQIHHLDGAEFETFVASLWNLQGWTTERTQRSGDGGRDILATRHLPYEITCKIEAKGWSEDDSVSAPTIRQYALLPGDEADHAVVVTSSSFTESAKRSAERHHIKLVDSARLLQLVKTLGAEKLLTAEFAVDDWEAVLSENHIDWTYKHSREANLVDTIPGIGPARSQSLASTDIHTVGDLLSADIEHLVEHTPFAESQLERWMNLAAFSKGGERPDAIDGVDQAEVTQLATADIYTVDDLEAGCAREIADRTDIGEEQLKLWIADAVCRNVPQVTAIPKIGHKRARELAKAGIHTVDDLAQAEREKIARQTNIGAQFLTEAIEHAEYWQK